MYETHTLTVPTAEEAQQLELLMEDESDNTRKWGWNDDIAVDNELREIGEEADAGDLLDTSA
jgi:hypothetical protein